MVDYDNVEESENFCPKCSSVMVWQYCQNIDCEDGEIVDEDPFWMTEVQICPDCKGTGIEQWCRKCGYGTNEARFE